MTEESSPDFRIEAILVLPHTWYKIVGGGRGVNESKLQAVRLGGILFINVVETGHCIECLYAGRPLFAIHSAEGT